MGVTQGISAAVYDLTGFSGAGSMTNWSGYNSGGSTPVYHAPAPVHVVHAAAAPAPAAHQTAHPATRVHAASTPRATHHAASTTHTVHHAAPVPRTIVHDRYNPGQLAF
jgi:hypothetical protein